MNRKTVSIMIIIAMVLATIVIPASPALADNALVAKFVIGQASYTVNGASHSMDVAPYIENNRTYLPVRYAAYAVGVTDSGITWNGATGTTTIVKGSDTIAMVIGSTNMAVDGKSITMDVAPEIRGGRTMLPIGFVGQALGAQVDWDQATQTVTLTLGQPVPPANQIEMTAAMNGTLQPPPGAAASPTGGFVPQCKEIDFTAGNQTATYTGLDGSTRPFDLGAPAMVIATSDGIGVKSLISHFPSVYSIGTSIEIDPTANIPNGIALYAPFISIAEAFGVPAANIEWDGTHLAVFGMYQHADNYRVLTVGSRDVIAKVDGNNPAIATGTLNFPLCVLNAQPALGLTSVSDFDGMLFALPGTPNLIYAGVNGNHWDAPTGTAAVGCST